MSADGVSKTNTGNGMSMAFCQNKASETVAVTRDGGSVTLTVAPKTGQPCTASLSDGTFQIRHSNSLQHQDCMDQQDIGDLPVVGGNGTASVSEAALDPLDDWICVTGPGTSLSQGHAMKIAVV